MRGPGDSTPWAAPLSAADYSMRPGLWLLPVVFFGLGAWLEAFRVPVMHWLKGASGL